MKFLGSGALKPPRSVYLPPKRATRGHGLLVPSFDNGTVLLKDADGDVVRVAWEPAKSSVEDKKRGHSGVRPLVQKTPTSASRRRSLAAGVYTLIGYRLIRSDKAGRTWFVSATAPRGIRKVAVVAGKQKTLEIDQQVAIDCSARRTKMGLRLLVTVCGEIESGMSIYRDGRRIPIEYRVLDGDGKVIARGGMEYG